MKGLRDAGFSEDLNELQYTVYGKPYLVNGPDFSISHSGNRVVCVLSKRGRVGIDLEEINDLPIHDFKPYFSEWEWKIITSAQEPLLTFYHYWTAKESICKADGRGLNLPLDSLKIEDNQKIQINNYCWNIREISLFRNYACHIAFEESSTGIKLKEYSPNNILDFG